MRQSRPIDNLFISVGGGGLIGGIAAYMKEVSPKTRIIGCSPAASCVMARSVEAGTVLDLPSEDTLSDGTAGGMEADTITFPFCRDLVDHWIDVSEDEIADAMRTFIDGHHMLLEGAAGVALAGALQGRPRMDARPLRRRHLWRQYQPRCSEDRHLSAPARLFSPEEIRKRLETIDPITCVEEAFRSFSRGEAIVPPPGELIFENPPGDVHIKYGYIGGGEFYVVKIASGFYENPRHGLPSSNGVMLAFNRQTGALAAILDDRGHLTDMRTAAAGAVAAKYLAPADVETIGVIGTGMQAELQVKFLQSVQALPKHPRLGTPAGGCRKLCRAYAARRTSPLRSPRASTTWRNAAGSSSPRRPSHEPPSSTPHDAAPEPM